VVKGLVVLDEAGGEVRVKNMKCSTSLSLGDECLTNSIYGMRLFCLQTCPLRLKCSFSKYASSYF
jgi:hypothetical protein